MMSYIQNCNCEATELDGEWIILNTDEFSVTKLNAVGGYCWTLLDRAQTAESLTDDLLTRFTESQSKDQVQKDIEEFLNHLLHCGLIQHVD